jgi:hypothetical protein
VPPVTTPKKRHQLEPITYDELLGNAGMSGFVSFLESPRGTAAAAAPAPELKVVRGPAERKSHIRRAATVEDGHSLAEQAVYTALWKAAVPVTEAINADRQIRIGYHRLAQLTRLSWVSVKANLRSLEKKLALEVTNSENSAIQQGKGYLVYSPGAILDRRKRAGLEWVRRTRGVELLNRAEVI